MHRTPRTLLLSVVALGSLATAAAAATPPTTMPFGDQMAGMHAGGGHGAGMHSMVMADARVHASLLDDPAMRAHMASYGVNVDQMRGWHDQAVSVEVMHEALAEQGIDVDAMQADCPMLTGAMASMHGNGGDHHGHHDTPGR